MLKHNTIDPQTIIADQEVISIYFLNDKTLPMSDIEVSLQQLGYTTKLSDTIDAIEHELFNLIDIYNQYKSYQLFILINTMALNETINHKINRLKQQYNDNIHFVYYSDNNNLMSHLQGIRHHGEAFLSYPFETDEVSEVIKLLSEVESQNYRILLIDDDESMGKYYSYVFKKAGIECQYEKSIESIMDKVTEFKPELLLIDYYMPECSGIELTKMMRQRIDIDFIPIVYLSSETDPLIHLKSITLGVDDFLYKGTQSKYIVSNIKSRIDRARTLKKSMMTDSLTHLYNHAMIKEQFDLELAKAQRSSTEVSYAMIDIDKFKQVNDTYGHMVGDKIIKTLSHFLKNKLRKTDIVGRYGGEEFAVILPDTTKKKAYRVIDKLRREFSQILHISEATSFKVTFSCGIASFPEKIDQDEIVEQADQCLYLAKEKGRNKIVHSINNNS